MATTRLLLSEVDMSIVKPLYNGKKVGPGNWPPAQEMVNLDEYDKRRYATIHSKVVNMEQIITDKGYDVARRFSKTSRQEVFDVLRTHPREHKYTSAQYMQERLLYWRRELIQWGSFNAQPQTQAKPTYRPAGVANHGLMGEIAQLKERVVALEERFEFYIPELEYRNAELREQNAVLEARQADLEKQHAELEHHAALFGYPYPSLDNDQPQSFVDSQPSQQFPAFEQEPQPEQYFYTQPE